MAARSLGRAFLRLPSVPVFKVCCGIAVGVILAVSDGVR
jgi:hypothetical protein